MGEWDPKRLTLMFGPLEVGGYADGEMIKIEYLGEGDKWAVGTAGEVARVRSYDKRAKVTARIMGTRKDVNAALVAHFAAGNPLLPVIVNSVSTGSVHASGEGCLAKPPDETFGPEVPVREYEFMVGIMSNVVSPV